MRLAAAVVARAKAPRWLVRCVVLALAVSVVGLMPATKASATGVAEENFTLTGTWSCTSNCGLRGVWGIQGTANLCEESEVELDTFFPFDVPLPLACPGAHFAGNVNSTCSGAVCVEQGVVDFYFPDASDPGNTIGPIPVGIVGTATVYTIVASLGQYEQGYTLNAAFEAADQIPWVGVAGWAGAGELHGGACAGTVATCYVNQFFGLSITGYEAD